MGDITADWSWNEFGCRCGKCKYSDGYQIDLELVKKLQIIRDVYGKPMKVNSGIRCPAHNFNEGGRPLSYHLPSQDCKAADIAMTNRKGRIVIVRKALELGMSVGIYKTFIHLDNRLNQTIF